MAKADTKKKAKNAELKRTPDDVIEYLSESVKDFAFSDYVAVKSGPRGMLLSFGKAHPRSDKFVIFQEVLLPLDVAFSLGRVVQSQFERLIEEGHVQVENAPEGKRGAK